MRCLVIFGVIFSSLSANAQLSKGGQPVAWGEEIAREGIPLIQLHAISTPPDLGEVTSGSFSYGVQRDLPIDIPALGLWSDLEDGGRVCRLMIGSEGALMISVQFSEWDLPEGGMVYLFDADRTMFIGGFDHWNRSPIGTMATAVIPGDRIVIEYRLPAGAPDGTLKVQSITHCYRDIFGLRQARDIDPGYQSAPCHINVACPEASAWQDQKRAVALFLRPTGDGCTGVLLNNTATPGRPFFHVANHCYQPTEDQWVFYFNYEAAGCVGNSGPTTQTLTGGTVRANSYLKDFVLLELYNTPPANYNVYYAGWDRSGNTPQSGTVIHHPLFDVKKITFNDDPVTSIAHPDGFQLWRNFWDQGIVEPVSSGAPMFDQNKRMVGHMFDGSQNCTNATTAHTDCSKFSFSWDGSSSTSRLRDWLDPSNSVTQLNGYDPNSAASIKVRVRAFLEGPFNAGNGLMNATLRANGLVPLNEPYSSIGYTHVNGGGGETTTSQVLSVSNNDAIVDWVVVELRNKNNSAQVLATRCALIQRDGDIVDVNGTSDVSFNMPSDQYYIAVRHRNHLGIMTATAPLLTSSADLLDLGGPISLFGGSNATKTIAGKKLMYAGDVNGNSMLRYVGENNDRDMILLKIGGSIPTNTVNGYHREDLNMDGSVRYTGANNDRDSILVNIGGTIPTNIRSASLP